MEVMMLRNIILSSLLLFSIVQASSYWDCRVSISDHGSFHSYMTVEVKADRRSKAEQQALYQRGRVKHFWKYYDVCSVWEECRFKIYETDYCKRQ